MVQHEHSYLSEQKKVTTIQQRKTGGHVIIVCKIQLNAQKQIKKILIILIHAGGVFPKC